MPSAWIVTHLAADGSKRYRCKYRLGGRESRNRYAGSFRRHADALARKRWVEAELSAMRVPDLRLAAQEPAAAVTVATAAERWLASRIDHSPNSHIAARGNINRFLPHLGSHPVDTLDAATVADMVTDLHEQGRKRETIRKSLGALAMTLDHAGVTPNPARDKVAVRLPRGDTQKVRPPSAAHVEDVWRVIARKYRLPIVVMESTGMRVGELEGLRWGDVDEPRGRWLVRGELNHTGDDRWVKPPPVVLYAVTGLVAREDRDPEARVFADCDQAAFRAELTRACRLAGVPHFSPHALRHRRISLWVRQGEDVARIGAWVGQRNLAVTLNTYTHVLIDDAEIPLADLVN
jgi:integrase